MGRRIAQVYAVIYDDYNNIFITRRNRVGYFFRDQSGGGSIRWEGEAVLGGGNFSLPGGVLTGVDPVDCAIQKLQDETNISVDSQMLISSPMPYFEQSAGTEYYGVYFKALSPLMEICEEVTHNLKHANAAVQAIREKTFKGDYSALRKRYVNCPLANEILYCQVISSKDVGYYFKLGDPQTGIFYSMVKNLL
jgi:hypothetical protein